MSVGTQLNLFIEPSHEGSPDSDSATTPHVPYRAKRKYPRMADRPPAPKPQWVQLSPRNAYLLVGLSKVMCGGGCQHFIRERDLLVYRGIKMCPACWSRDAAIEKGMGDRRAMTPRVPLHLRAIRMAEADGLREAVRARAQGCGCGDESEVAG